MVAHAHAVHIANAWILADGEGRRFLIDTGHRLERAGLKRSLRRAGITKPGDLTAVLLTHRHSDHAGNAEWVRNRYDCPVICHESDADALSGAREPMRLSGRGAPLLHEFLCNVEDRFLARCTVDEHLTAGDWRWGFEVVHVGGHTEGSVLLLHRPTGALFTGDALLAGAPAQRVRANLQLAMPVYSVDAAACRRAVLGYLATTPDIKKLCSGHGPMVEAGLGRRLQRFRQISTSAK